MSGEGGKLSKSDLREDEFLEWVMKAVDYVRERYQVFLGGVLLVAVGVMGVQYIIDSQERSRSEAAADLGEALMLDEQGDTTGVFQSIEAIVDRYDGTPAAGQSLIMLANRRFAQEEYAAAGELYQRYLREYGGDNPLLEYGARRGLAAILEARGQVQEAAQEFLEIAQQQPEDALVNALALWDAAQCYRRLGDVAQRRQLLQRIVRTHARLPVAARARAALAML